jgi:Family of unknown function (DUF5335)
MPTLDIPRTEWGAFLDTFSRQHERWLITVEVLTPELGAHREVRDKPLAGISEDRKRGDTASIAISAGELPQDHVTHVIHRPSRVAMEQTEDGAHKGLRIESEDGETTLVRFRSPALPETLDGMGSR